MQSFDDESPALTAKRVGPQFYYIRIASQTAAVAFHRFVKYLRSALHRRERSCDAVAKRSLCETDQLH